MELEERLSYLENVRDWQSLVDELEKGIVSPAGNTTKAQFHLKLGRVLETKFLAGVKALKHFQDAYKLNPALTESLEAARSVYWDLGKLNMVQKLLELELKAGADGVQSSALLIELGDVLCDQGEWEKAAATLRSRPQRERRQKRRGERLPRRHAARRYRLARASRGSAQGTGRSQGGFGKSAPSFAGVAHCAPLCSGRGRRDAGARLFEQPRGPAGGGSLRGSARRAGAPGCARTGATSGACRAAEPRRREDAWPSPSAPAGCCGTRTWRSGRAFSKRR